MQIPDVTSKQPMCHLHRWLQEKPIPPAHQLNSKSLSEPADPSAVSPCDWAKNQECHRCHKNCQSTGVHRIVEHHEKHHNQSMAPRGHKLIDCASHHHPCKTIVGLGLHITCTRLRLNITSSHLEHVVDLTHLLTLLISLSSSSSINIGHEKTHQPSQKICSFPTCVQITWIQMCFHLVDCENSSSQQTLQVKLFDVDMFESSCPSALEERVLTRSL